MRRRRMASWLAGGVVVLAACGSPSTTEPAAQPDAPATTDLPAASTEVTTEPDGTAAPVTTGASDDTAAPVTSGASDGTAATETTEPPEGSTSESPESTVATASTPTATEPPATEPALDAACSVDNTATDVADGPVPALEVRAESLANPLPDVAVRQINCAGGWVNLKNAIPNDQPLLVWFWAPH